MMNILNEHLSKLGRDDYIEINLDKVADFPYQHAISPFFVARPASSRLSVSRPSSSSDAYRMGRGIADGLVREVNSQPPGRVEFEHRIEHRNKSPERDTYTEGIINKLWLAKW